MKRKETDRVKTLQEYIQHKSSQSHFSELFELLAPSLCGYARQYVTPEEAEETVYTIFTRLWKNRATILEINNLKVYLYKSVRFEVGKINQRKKGSYVTIDETLEVNFLASSPDSPYTKLLEHELKTILDEAIEGLPPQCKAAFKLVKEEGLKYKEAAEALGISKNTVENHLVKALKALKKALRDYEKGQKGSHNRFKTACLHFFCFFFRVG